MVQEVIVGVIVAAAVLYAVWRWMPARWRHAMALRVAAGSHGAGWIDETRAAELAARLAKTGGCGSCDSCAGCGAKTKDGAVAGSTDIATAQTR